MNWIKFATSGASLFVFTLCRRRGFLWISNINNGVIACVLYTRGLHTRTENNTNDFRLLFIESYTYMCYTNEGNSFTWRLENTSVRVHPLFITTTLYHPSWFFVSSFVILRYYLRRRNNNSSQYEYALNLSYNLATKDILILIRVPSSWMLVIKIIKKKFQLTSKWQIREIPVESHSLTKWVERGWSVQFVNILFFTPGNFIRTLFYL